MIVPEFENGIPDDLFVHKLDSNLECIVCFKILNQPVMCCRNGHVVCRNCIEPVIVSGKSCPSGCQAPIMDVIPVLSLRSLIDDCLVKCSLSENSECNWIGKLSTRDAHRATCPCAEVQCMLFANGLCTPTCKRKQANEPNFLLEDQYHAGQWLISDLNFVYYGAANAEKMRHGVGVMKFESHGKIHFFDGEFEDGKRIHGKEIAHNGDTYIGHFVMGKWHGYGSMSLANGDTCVGMFGEDGLHGFGTYNYFSGNKYVGDFIDWLREGHGIFTWTNGNEFEGSWYLDKREGKGTYTTSSDGSVLHGEWKDGKMDGLGVTVYANGKRVASEWKNGVQLC